MENLPRISVITPTYNQGKFIEATIQSVIQQQYPNLQFIVIDGGSSDKTVEILKKYETHFSYWVSEKDKGQTDAINKGMKMADGEIITWLNSDDCFLPGTLHEVAREWKQQPFDMLVGNCVFIDETGKEISREPKSALIDKKWYKPFVKECIINQPSSFFSRNAHTAAGGFDHNLHYAMDVDFWMKLAAKNLKFRYTDTFFTAFRRHGNAKSAGGNIPFIEDTMHSEYYRHGLKKDNPVYYREVRKNLVREYYRSLRMEHFTGKLIKTFFRFVWIYPLMSAGELSKYAGTKLRLKSKSITQRK